MQKNISAEPSSLEDRVLTSFASRASGMTGADVEQLIRRARRMARAAKRPMTYSDVETVFDALRPPLPPELKERFAYHEAGHAIVAIAYNFNSIDRITLSDDAGDPSIAGTFATNKAATEDQVMSLIAVGLAGRAAEELVYGTPSVYSGGGPGSDLAMVTKFAYMLETSFGFAKDLELVYHELPDVSAAIALSRELREKVSGRLELSRLAACQLLQSHRNTLDWLANELLLVGTLEGRELQIALAEVRAMMDKNTTQSR